MPEQLHERKAKITGRIHRIEGVQPLKNGFKQRFMIEIPELKDEMNGRVLRRLQYFWIEIYSTKQTDSRFIDSRKIKELVCVSVYLNSYHWLDQRDGLTCVCHLNFDQWLKVEGGTNG